MTSFQSFESTSGHNLSQKCVSPIRWTCLDAVVGKCVPNKSGKYVTRDQCERALQCNLGTPIYPTSKRKCII